MHVVVILNNSGSAVGEDNQGSFSVLFSVLTDEEFNGVSPRNVKLFSQL